jgi:hypothetical protein
MVNAKTEEMASKYVAADEHLINVITAYTSGGFGRRILAVTDRRLIMVKSAYWIVRDKGLIWAEDPATLALGGATRTLVNGGESGNLYVTIRRAIGLRDALNVIPIFIGKTRAGAANAQVLYSAIQGRF